MPIAGIKTRGDLQNDLFCLQEERDYFESRFLEQVSEIDALKQELSKSKKEIRRLRMFLMQQQQDEEDGCDRDRFLVPPDQIEAATPKNHNRGSFRESTTAADGTITASRRTTSNHSDTPTSNNNDDNNGSNIACTAKHADATSTEELLQAQALDDDSRSLQHIAEKDDASSLTAEEIEELDQQDEALEQEHGHTRQRQRRQGNQNANANANANSNQGYKTPPRYVHEHDSDDEEEEDVRKSAEKLLMWASYRSTISRGNSSRDLSSVASPSVRTYTSGSARQSLLGKMIETENTEDDDDSDDDEGLTSTQAQAHEEEKKEDDGDGDGDGDGNHNNNDNHNNNHNDNQDAQKEAAY